MLGKGRPLKVHDLGARHVFLIKMVSRLNVKLCRSDGETYEKLMLKVFFLYKTENLHDSFFSSKEYTPTIIV